MALDEQRVRDDANHPEWRPPDERVSHHGFFPVDVKFVDVPHAGESAADHLVNEPCRPIKLYDLCSQALSNSEMDALESNEVTQPEQSRGLSADCPLTGEGGHSDVRIHITREIEAEFDRGGDACFDDDSGHARCDFEGTIES